MLLEVKAEVELEIDSRRSRGGGRRIGSVNVGDNVRGRIRVSVSVGVSIGSRVGVTDSVTVKDGVLVR